jgi:transcriptional regulator with XRE-family HTH domain
MQGRAARRQTRRGPDPVDIHVAMRVRERRIELGLTQPEVAGELGITYQHLYKFEKVKSRISASRLYGLSKALGVPVTFFFEGLAETEAKTQKPKRSKAAQQR